MINNLDLLRKKEIPESMYDQDFLYLVKASKSEVEKPVTLIEKVLISRFKVGDSGAFSSIFTAYYKDLVLFAARFTKEKDSAEEIVQDTFVKLWEEHETVNINVSLKSFLLKSVQNKCIDLLRHKKIMQAHNSYVLELPPLLECDTDNYILYSELHDQMEAALDKLPDEISDAFRMNRFKGLKYFEIAEILDVSVRTVEVRIGRALNMLRIHLKDYILIIVFLYLLFL